VPIKFASPVEVVGLSASVIAASAVGGLVAPLREHLLIDLEVNAENHFTAMERDSEVAHGSNFADLQAVDVALPRLVSIPIAGSGELGIDLRWKRFAAGFPIYEDALITISAMYRTISTAELVRLRGENSTD
jgi:hypothetical protein